MGGLVFCGVWQFFSPAKALLSDPEQVDCPPLAGAQWVENLMPDF